MRLYWERERVAEGEPVWLERKFDFKVGEHHVRGRVDRVDRLPDGDYELIDYKTGERKTEAELENDLQLALYRLAAREAWEVEASTGSYYYVLDAEKVAAPTKPDDAERVERTVLQVGEGVLGQDFEPRPSPTVCSWCDYRLICPAAESPETACGLAAVAALAQEAAGTRGRSCRRRAGRRPPRSAGRPVRPRSARPAPRSPGWRRRAADLLLVVARFLLQLGGLDGDPGQALEPAQQRQRRLRVGDRGDVVGHRRPERGGGRSRPGGSSRGRRRRSRSGPRSWSARGRAPRPAPRRRRGR